MKKKLLALMLALTMCFGSTMTVSAAMPILTGSGSTGSSNSDKSQLIRQPEQQEQTEQPSYKVEYTKMELNVIKSLFDSEYYAKMYPDVVVALGNNKEALWNHYVNHGLAEGRQINKDFNVLAYSAAYPDLKKAFGNDLVAYYMHYATIGKNENRQLTTIEKAANAGVIVTGMKGQVIAKPAPVAPKINPVSNSNSSSNESSLSSAVQGTINNGGSSSSGSSSSESEDKQPEEKGCQHSYEKWCSSIDTETHQPYIECSKCGAKIYENPEKHNFEWKQFTEDNQLVHYQVCSVCGWVSDHSPCASDSYKHDGREHWKECTTCGKSFTERGDHHFENGQCTECGYACEHDWSEGECTLCHISCDHAEKTLVKEKTERIDETRHKATYKCNVCDEAIIQEEDCTYGDFVSTGKESHAKYCKCGRTETANHVFAYTNKDDVNHIKSCTLCNYSEDEGHYNNESIESIDDTYHGNQCYFCKGYYNKVKHTFDGEKICTGCPYIHKHVWESGKSKSDDDSTHTTTKTCKICGATESGATEDHTPIYKNCGDKQHIKICMCCDWVDTKAEDCTPDEGFTVNKGDYHAKYCAYCNQVCETASHTFVNGRCDECGKPEDEYDFYY